MTDAARPFRIAHAQLLKDQLQRLATRAHQCGMVNEFYGAINTHQTHPCPSSIIKVRMAAIQAG